MSIVLILGASSDLGQSLAQIFASKGYSVWQAGRDLESLKISTEDLKIRFDTDGKTFYFDAEKIQTHEDFYGNLPELPDMVIYVVGFMGDYPPLKAPWPVVQRILDCNYIGAVSIINIFAREMEVKKNGTIIGISSVAGERGRQSNFLYGSAKSGFSTYLSGLRNYLYSSGVKVITVKPGFMKTKMTEGLNLPPILTAETDEVANEIYFGFLKGKNIIYTKPIWRLIMLVIKSIPESIFKKLSL